VGPFRSETDETFFWFKLFFYFIYLFFVLQGNLLCISFMVYCSRVGLSLGHLYGCDPLLEDLFWVHVKVGILCPRGINRLLIQFGSFLLLCGNNSARFIYLFM